MVTSSILVERTHSSVAQLVERQAVNLYVVGSIPAGGVFKMGIPHFKNYLETRVVLPVKDVDHVEVSDDALPRA